MTRRPWPPHVWALFAYACAVVVFSWPLPLHLGTHFTGSPAGDTGVYVWNQWVFHHELLGHRSPYFTDRIFALTGRANLSLHNYTTFQNLLALPLIGPFGVVATFNLVYLAMIVLTGYATFILARHITGRDPESWLAGLLFACSPVLVTRGGGHFSLVAAAPLAIFFLLLLRAQGRQRWSDAFALGATVWWAASTDVYFAVYCLMIGGMVTIGRVLTVTRRDRAAAHRAVPWTLDVMLFSIAGLVLAIAVSGGWDIHVFNRMARMRTLYTPMLALTLLAVLRGAWSYRAMLVPHFRHEAWRVARLAAAASGFSAVLMSPVLYAVGVRVADGRWDPTGPVFWRSSPSGLDLINYLLPNPNHPFAPAAIRAWLTPRPDAYFENVASLTFVALATIVIARCAGWRIPRLWAGTAAIFAALSLGPFIHVAGVNTFVPGPWAFLRYVPVVGLARTPSRFSIVVMLAVAMLFASALAWLGQRWPRRRRWLLVGVGALLIFEILPVPLPLYSAEIPSIYRQIAAAPGEGRVLELPFGVRDGTSSYGDFTARSEYFQTLHQKPLAGGYLSRVSRRRVNDTMNIATAAALVTLSEGRSLDPSRERTLVEEGPAFIRTARIAFVVVDRARASDQLRTFAIRAFRLRLIETDGDFELYTPPLLAD